MKNQDRMDWILAGLILAGLLFFLLVAPAVTAWGVITGRLDIETLEPAGVEERIRGETWRILENLKEGDKRNGNKSTDQWIYRADRSHPAEGSKGQRV